MIIIMIIIIIIIILITIMKILIKMIIIEIIMIIIILTRNWQVIDKKEQKGIIIDIAAPANVSVEEQKKKKWKSTRI